MLNIFCSFRLNVYVFREGHKNWQNLHRQFDSMYYVVTVKLTVKILSIFVAFLENMNFNSQG